MKNISTTLFVFILIAAGLFGWFVLQPKTPKLTIPALEQITTPTKPVDQTQLKAEYQQKLKDILVEFSANYRAAAEADKAKLADIARAKVLALMVPTELKDLHLNLVLALSTVSRGEGESADKFNAILKDNSWLQITLLPKES